MKDNLPDLLHADVTQILIKAFYEVYRELGYGFLERVYENSVALTARELGLEIKQQQKIRVHYRGVVVGRYYPDILANGVVIAEIKSSRTLAERHEAQLLNYLKATKYEVGLLLNFGLKPEHKRKIYENQRKGNFSWLREK